MVKHNFEEKQICGAPTTNCEERKIIFFHECFINFPKDKVRKVLQPNKAKQNRMQLECITLHK